MLIPLRIYLDLSKMNIGLYPAVSKFTEIAKTLLGIFKHKKYRTKQYITYFWLNSLFKQIVL